MNACRWGDIDERKPHISHRVSALNPVDDASPDERYDPRQGRDASTLVAIPVLAILLYGTLMLSERRSGHIIMLVGSLLTLGMPVLHVMTPEGFFHGAIARSSPAFLFVWTLHAMGLMGLFCFILSVRGLWSLRRSQPR